MVAFWSPNHGQTGTTTTAMTMASMIAIHNNYKVLIGHSHFERSTMERCLLPKQRNEDQDMLSFSDNGLDALRRLAKNSRLSPDMISNYTTPLMAGNRLDMLQGIAGFNTVDEEEDIHLIRKIFIQSKAAYDLVMVDVHSGTTKELTKKLLEDADMVVVCLNQNLWLLEDFFGDAFVALMLSGKNVLYHLCRYDGDSKYNAKNLSRLFEMTPMMVTPYWPEMMDAANNGRLLDFFMRHSGSTKRDRFYPYIQRISQSMDILIDELSIGSREVQIP